MVRVEYRFCPNMIVIDTPGLLSAPAKLRHMNEQQRQLQQVRSQHLPVHACAWLRTQPLGSTDSPPLSM